jgi:hypothetical protein
MRWSDRPGRWSLLAAGVGEGAVAPTLELTWPRPVTTPFLWPGVAAGAFLVLLGLVLLVLARRKKARAGTATDDGPDRIPVRELTPDDDEKAHKDRKVRKARGARKAVAAQEPATPGTPQPAQHDVEHETTGLSHPTETVPTTTGAIRTRRELRAQEEARRAADHGGAGRRQRTRTGSLPAVEPTAPLPPAAEGADGGEGEPTPDSREGRAAAWRAAWGFTPGQSTGQGTGQGTGQDDDAGRPGTTDGGTR